MRAARKFRGGDFLRYLELAPPRKMLRIFRPSLKGRVVYFTSPFFCPPKRSQRFGFFFGVDIRPRHRLARIGLERMDAAAKVAHPRVMHAGLPGVAVSRTPSPLWLPDLVRTQQIDFRFHRRARFFSSGSAKSGFRTVAMLLPTWALVSAKVRALSIKLSRSLAIGVARADSNAISRMK